MTKLRNLLVLLIAIPMASALAQYVEVAASGGGRYECRVDGVPVSAHTSEYKASEKAANLKLANPESTVVCEINRSLIATLTAAGKALVAEANADVLVGGVDEYPSGNPGNPLINETFDTTPLANDQQPYYDDGTAFDQAAMPETGSNALRYQWTEGDVGTNGLLELRSIFYNGSGVELVSDLSVTFDFASTTNFDDINPGASSLVHLVYLRTNLDDLWGDNTTIYVEPDGDGCFWMDLNKSDEPVTWETVHDTACVDVYDGSVHSIDLRIKKNTFGNADGIIVLKVDDTTVIDRDDIEIFIYEDQFFTKVGVGPYIVGGSNSATGPVAVYIDNLVVRSLESGSVSEPATSVFQFESPTYSTIEGNGTVTATVTRTGSTSGTASVDVDSSNGTATAGSDYTAVNSTLSFADSEASKAVVVTIADDDSTVEGAETFTLALSSPSGSNTLGAQDTATVTINDPATSDTWLDDVGLEWSDGIEPGDPSVDYSTGGNRAYWFDADASDSNTDCTYAAPCNGNRFEEVFGYWSGGSYIKGTLNGGDHVYLKGTFTPSNSERIITFRNSQGGTADDPTLIRSWLGTARATFDGEHSSGVGMSLGVNSTGEAAFEVRNIYFRRSVGAPLTFEAASDIHVHSIEIEDTISTNYASGAANYGAITFNMNYSNTVQSVLLHNSVFTNNNDDENGDLAPSANRNNVGSINLMTTNSYASNREGSKFTAYLNVVDDGVHAFRNKHSGNVDMEIYKNKVSNHITFCFCRFMGDQYLHHNLSIDNGSFIQANYENAVPSQSTAHRVESNTIVGSGGLILTANQKDLVSNSHTVSIDINNNLFTRSTSSRVLQFGLYGSDGAYNLSSIDSDYNYYYLPNQDESDNFMVRDTTNYNFTNAMTNIGDTGSDFQADPDFDTDYTLQEGSDALTASESGGEVGAFAP